MTACAVLLALAVAQPDALGADEADYLRRKWREETSDLSTGLDYPALGRELKSLVPKWTAESATWCEVKSRIFAYLCDKVAIDISEHDWFPTFAYWSRDTMRPARKIDERHPVNKIISARDEEVTKARLGRVDRGPGDAWWMYHDFDHSAPDWDEVLSVGFPGMAKRLEADWRDDDFHRSRKRAADGVLHLLDRLIARGEKRSEELRAKSEDSVRTARVRKLTASLKRLRAGAPKTALDALNTIYLYWVVSEEFEGIQVRTLGNLDRLIAPFYTADLAAGRTTEAEFREQLRHFWWQWGSMDYYWGQPMYFGGTKADGTSEYSDVSRILLEVHDELALPTPKLHLKIGKSTPDWVWEKALDMSRRMRPISYIGEEAHWRVIRAMGYGETEAREFALWGCYEWAIKDGANDICAGCVNLLKPVERILSDAAGGERRVCALKDFDAFKAEYLRRIVDTVVTARTRMYTNETCLAEINPSLLFTLASGRAVAAGKDAFAGGLVHGNNSGIWMVGLGTTVDALMAVREIVYERGELSLAALGKVMAANWKDHEELRLRMLRSKRKWGNNDPEANALAREITAGISKVVNGIPNARGGRFKASGHSSRNHYSFGSWTGATPDGRKACEEISKNISPTMGADTEGATALILSVANLDARDLPSDFALDVALLPDTVAGEKGLLAMRTLIEQYFANGGLVIQFNILDPKTLRDAQKHPEKYENLQVRVTGWNVRWNDIPKVEQDKFILRQENIAQ